MAEHLVLNVTEASAQLVLDKLKPILDRLDVPVSTRVAKTDVIVYGGKVR